MAFAALLGLGTSGNLPHDADPTSDAGSMEKEDARCLPAGQQRRTDATNAIRQ